MNRTLLTRMQLGRPVALTMDQAAEHANISRKTLQRAIAAGELPALRRGRLVRVLDRHLDDWLLRSATSKEERDDTP